MIVSLKWRKLAKIEKNLGSTREKHEILHLIVNENRTGTDVCIGMRLARFDAKMENIRKCAVHRTKQCNIFPFVFDQNLGEKC